MAVYIRCPSCKTDQHIKNKVCKKCNAPLPQRDKIYKVVVRCNGKTVTRQVPNNLELARQIETKIKAELIGGEYYDRRQAAKRDIKYKDFIKDKYLPYAKSNKKSWDREESLYSGPQKWDNMLK